MNTIKAKKTQNMLKRKPAKERGHIEHGFVVFYDIQPANRSSRPTARTELH